MVKISSSSTYFNKRVFPTIWFGFLALFLGGALVVGIGRKPVDELLLFILIPLIMAVLGYVFFKSILFDLVDEVWDAGNELIVKNRGREERIALADILNVNYNGWMNPPRITLSLRHPTMFGSEISFVPPFRFFHFSMPAIGRDLILRIDAAKRST